MTENLRTPTTDEILGRLLLAFFPVAAFAALGLGLQTTDLFNWYVTVMVITATTFTQALLRGPRLTQLTVTEATLAARFGPLRDAIDAVPLLRKGTTANGYQFVVAMLFGIFVATLEQVLGAGLFSWAGQPSDTLLSLFIVLFVAYFIAGTMRGAHLYESSEWMGKIKEGLHHATGLQKRPLSARTRTGISALLRAAFAVAVRIFALLVLPTVFGSGWMVAALVLAALTFVVGFDTVPGILRAALIAAKPVPRSTTSESGA